MAGPDENNKAGPHVEDDSEVEQLSRLHIWQMQAVRDVLFVAAVLAVFWFGYALRAVTVPLLVALLLAYLFEPLIRWMCRRPKMTRVRAVSLLLGGGIALVLIVLAIALPLAVSQTTSFVDDVREGRLRANIATLGKYVPDKYVDDFSNVLDLLPGDAQPARRTSAKDTGETANARPLDSGGAAVPAESPVAEPPDSGAEPRPMDERRLRELIDERIAAHQAAGAPSGEESRTDWIQIARHGAGTIVSVLGFIVQLGLLAFLIPFYFFFFSVWYPKVLAFGEKFIPQKNRSLTIELLSKMDNVVAGFVRGRIVIALIMGLLLAIGWMICGVPYAIPLGIVVGIFSAVPYLGLVGIPLACGLMFFDQLGVPAEARMAWWAILLWPSLVFFIVQFLDGYVLTPAIAGKATNLDPVTLLVAVLAGGSVLGVYGMLLAIPLAACGKIMLTDVLMPKIHDWTEGRAADPLPIERK